MKRYGKTAVTVLAGLALVLLMAACGGPEGNTEPALSGPAPDFELENFAGGRVRLSDHRGQVVLVNFWATWCPPCVKEVPDFVELYGKYRERGLVILGISVDRNPGAVLPAFIERHKINYPVLLDDGRVADDYGGITGIPTTFLIDREGVIRERYVGYRPKRVFEEAVKELL